MDSRCFFVAALWTVLVAAGVVTVQFPPRHREVPPFWCRGVRQVSEGSPGHMSAVRKEGEIDICKYSIISTKGVNCALHISVW